MGLFLTDCVCDPSARSDRLLVMPEPLGRPLSVQGDHSLTVACVADPVVGVYISATFGPISRLAGVWGRFHSSDFRRCECKANLQNSASPGSFRKRSKQWPVPGRETEKLAYVRAGNFGRFLRLWAIIDVSESGVVRLNGPKTSPESGPFAGLSRHGSTRVVLKVLM